MATGTYTGVMNVNNNDPIRPVKTIPVKLMVGTVGIQNTTFGIPTEFFIESELSEPIQPDDKFGIWNSGIGICFFKDI
ncbi:MAG: hypothetical protein R2942_16810 [Ignavibacteria bacterium]